jgi:phosphatidylserine decarboxylase
MATPLRNALSHFTGWASDRRVPGPLRGPLYSLYGAFTGANLSESRGPLNIYPSLGAFFCRRLVEGARPIEADPLFVASPVDGTFQSICAIEDDTVLQAKGRAYSVRELLAGVGADTELTGGQAWTVYLSPRDYHRIHAPETSTISAARWVSGCRYSVAPAVLDRRQVLSINERVVLRLETARGPLFLVLVGALNVGRIRVLGIEPAAEARISMPLAFERGAELARFEMGSTIVLLSPPGGLVPIEETRLAEAVAMGNRLARWGPA